MIIDALISIIVLFINGVFFILPEVSLPNQVSSVLESMITTWNAFIITFPYAQTATTIFFWIVVFEIGLLITKFFLGSRTPVHT